MECAGEKKREREGAREGKTYRAGEREREGRGGGERVGRTERERE